MHDLLQPIYINLGSVQMKAIVLDRLRLGLFALCLVVSIAGCAKDMAQSTSISQAHISQKQPEDPQENTSEIPALVTASPSLRQPTPVFTQATHTVVVYDVPVKELLFSLARDSDLNLDIDPSIDALISINAIKQTLNALLDRITYNAQLRYRIQNGVLNVEKDTPYLVNYAIDYLNISRTSIGSVAVSTQISSTGGNATSTANGGDIGNSSDTVVRNLTENAFWPTLERNLGQILGASVSAEVGGDSSNPNIIVNSESGTIGVRATQRQHGDVGKFIDSVLKNSQRQVLIEATIAEVNLSDGYQAGIDWNLINSSLGSGVDITQALTAVSLTTPPAFTLTNTDLDFGGNQLQATLRALETFGEVSVMSSPKVMAMNNQTALLKVVDNLIYFTVEVNIDNSGGGINGGNLTTFETEVNTVPVGFVMSVTPFIDASDSVILNVRPTISRVISFAQDPNPALADANVVSQIPVIQVREVESVLKVNSGDVAVIGGLMQDEVTQTSRGVPILGSLPWIGAAFRYDDDRKNKTELVIFLKPTVIHSASIDSDLKAFRQYLPTGTMN
jgi:general secretion pathway protein D